MKNIKNIKTAAIDIGSNTIKALFVDDSGAKVCALNKVVSLALSSQNGYISDEAIKRLCKVLDSMQHLINTADEVICVGTAVFRRSINGASIASMIERKYGFVLHIIDSTLESALVAKAAKIDNASLLVDIGGASLELICDDGSVSFDIGLVGFYELLCKAYTLRRANRGRAHRRFVAFAPKYRIRRKSNSRGLLQSFLKQGALASKYSASARAHKYASLCQNTVLCSKIGILHHFIADGIRYDSADESAYIYRRVKLSSLIQTAHKLAKMPPSKARLYVGDGRQEFLVCGVVLLCGVFGRALLPLSYRAQSAKDTEFVCFDDAILHGLLKCDLDEEFYSHCINH